MACGRKSPAEEEKNQINEYDVDSPEIQYGSGFNDALLLILFANATGNFDTALSRFEINELIQCEPVKSNLENVRRILKL